MHTAGSSTPIVIRAAVPEDAAWILPLSSRLHDFGPPPWRARDAMDRAVAAALAVALRAPPDEAVVLVAEDADHVPLGFVHVHTAVDFFTHEVHGHVSDLAVAPAAEGRGAGRALMAAAEAWARAHGHRLLTLNVFGNNLRARDLYERLGYQPDTTKLVKVL